MSRLTDEQVAQLIEFDRNSTATRTALAREVQAWRDKYGDLDSAPDVLRSDELAQIATSLTRLAAYDSLVNGGPCETCEGKGKVRNPSELTRVHVNTFSSVPCPDCDGTGTRPGLIARLEAIWAQTDATDGPNSNRLAAIIAELREMTR